MNFAGINYLAIIAAAVAAFAFGAAWYSALSRPWIKATRIDPTTVKMSAVPFVTSFVCELVMAWVMAGVIGHLGTGQVT
jgi:hypothetical protein